MSIYNRASSYTRPSTAAQNQTQFMKSIEFLKGFKPEPSEEPAFHKQLPDF